MFHHFLHGLFGKFFPTLFLPLSSHSVFQIKKLSDLKTMKSTASKLNATSTLLNGVERIFMDIVILQ